MFESLLNVPLVLGKITTNKNLKKKQETSPLCVFHFLSLAQVVTPFFGFQKSISLKGKSIIAFFAKKINSKINDKHSSNLHFLHATYYAFADKSTLT